MGWVIFCEFVSLFVNLLVNLFVSLYVSLYVSLFVSLKYLTFNYKHQKYSLNLSSTYSQFWHAVVCPRETGMHMLLKL